MIEYWTSIIKSIEQKSPVWSQPAVLKTKHKKKTKTTQHDTATKFALIYGFMEVPFRITSRNSMLLTVDVLMI